MVPVSDVVNANTILFLLCSLSPAAAKSIDLELYRQTADSDGSTDQHILGSAFDLLTKDIEATGVIIDIDYADVLEDIPTLLKFLDVASYILPGSLYLHLKANDQLRIFLGRLLDGSLGSGETLIQNYLSEIAGLDGQDPLVDHLHDMVDRLYGSISQTDIFTDCLRNVHQLIDNEKLAIEADDEVHTHYRTTMREVIARFVTAADLFSNTAIYSDLCRIQDVMIKDFIAPTNFTGYNYLFTTDENALPLDLIERYRQRWYHYKVSHSWCSDYFTIRNMLPDAAQILAVYCFLYAICLTKDQFEKEVQALGITYLSPLYRQSITRLYSQEPPHG